MVCSRGRLDSRAGAEALPPAAESSAGDAGVEEHPARTASAVQAQARTIAVGARALSWASAYIMTSI
jgi:hypothetical protein